MIYDELEKMGVNLEQFKKVKERFSTQEQIEAHRLSLLNLLKALIFHEAYKKSNATAA